MQGGLGRENRLEDPGPAAQNRLQDAKGSGVGEAADATSSVAEGIESNSERLSGCGPMTLDSVPGSDMLKEAESADLRMEEKTCPTSSKPYVDASKQDSATPADKFVFDSQAGRTVRPQGFSLWGFIVGADKVRT